MAPAQRKLLVPLFREEIAPRFDLAGEALLVAFDEDGRETDRSTVLLAHSSAEELCRIALEEKVTAVVCNGVDEEYWQYLRWKRIEVLDNVMGPAEEAVERWRLGALKAGDILFDRSVPAGAASEGHDARSPDRSDDQSDRQSDSQSDRQPGGRRA